jgi:hypothetical protein
VNIVLQNKATLQYVDDAGLWTSKLEQARAFDTGLDAILFCLEHQFFNMQILGEFGDQRMNFAVSVTDHRDD